MDISFTSLILPAFIAGLVTFMAPCTLPLIPGFIASISGIDHAISTTEKKRSKIMLNSISYVLGFSIIFIFFGLMSGLVGGTLPLAREVLIKLGGIFIIIMGILGITNFSFQNIHFFSIPFPQKLRPGNPTSSFLLGTFFALAWSPCVGIVLASMLLLASTEDTAIGGALLLGIFSIGLAIPHLLVGLGIEKANYIINERRLAFNILRHLGNAFLIVLGILVFTDNLSLLNQYGFKIFDFLNYQAILKYL